MTLMEFNDDNQCNKNASNIYNAFRAQTKNNDGLNLSRFSLTKENIFLEPAPH
jgi:hypothetical protein